MRAIFQLLVAAGVGLFLALPGHAMNIKIQEWKFEKDAPGTVPAGFAPAKLNSDAGRWAVAKDPKAFSSSNMLMREGDGQSDKEQIIFIEGLEAGSIDLTIRIKSAADVEGQGGGVVFRADDERNYYVIWLSPHEKLVRLDKVVNGVVTHLQDLTVESADPGKWHTLRVLIHGPVMEAIFNNRQPLSAREGEWQFGSYKKGKIGLWAKGTAPIYFDTVRYTDMDDSTSASRPFGLEPAAPAPAQTPPTAPKK